MSSSRAARLASHRAVRRVTLALVGGGLLAFSSLAPAIAEEPPAGNPQSTSSGTVTPAQPATDTAPAQPAPEQAPLTAEQRAEAVIAAARAYLGVPYRVGSEGPNLMDCSGLVFRAFSDAGEVARVGGARLRAAGYQRWFAARGLFFTDEEQAVRGDLVMYANGEHIGIYLGDGRVISALVTGVTAHSIGGITLPVTGFLKLEWTGQPRDPIPGLPTIPSPADDPEAPAALVPSSAWTPLVDPELVALNTDVVERTDMRRSNSRTFENADGTFTTEFFAQPVFYLPAGASRLEPIDLRLVTDEKDPSTATVAASPAQVVVNAPDSQAAGIAASDGLHTVSLGLPRESGASTIVPEVSADGRYADFADLLADGGGVRVFPRADGFKVFLVLPREPKANKFTFTVGSGELTLVSELDGTVTLRDATDATVGRFAQPMMLDSSDIDGGGGGLFTAATGLSTATNDTGSTLTVSIERAYLDEAVYPVYVDLTLADFPSAADAGAQTFTSSTHPNGNFSTYQRPESPSYYELWHGRQPGSRNDNEALLRFGGVAQTLAGVAVQSAALKAFPYWQSADETEAATWVRRVSSDWAAATTTWNLKPSVDTADLGEFATTQGAWSDIDLTQYVSEIVSGAQPDYGLMLHANGAGRGNWKRFVADGAAGELSLAPRLAVTWSGLRPIALPSDGAIAPGTLSWIHPALAPLPSKVAIRVVFDGSGKTFEQILKNGEAAQGTWEMPGKKLLSGKSYTWQVRAKYGDSTAWSPWSEAITFVVPATTAASPPIWKVQPSTTVY